MSRDESTVDRRDFLKTASAAGIGLAMSSHVSPLVAQGRSPNETVRVAVAGLNSRGLTHVQDVIKSPNAQLAYLCDVDSQVLAKAGDIAAKAGSTGVQKIADFRRALDDKDVDALFIAMPDHWHTPAAIMALQAGKHVYVEKPGSHNPHEAELIVQAKQKHGRVVQLGSQQRSDPRTREVIRAIHDGVIGRAYMARAWYANKRNTIGRGAPVTVPRPLALDTRSSTSTWRAGYQPRSPVHSPARRRPRRLRR